FVIQKAKLSIHDKDNVRIQYRFLLLAFFHIDG
ncbi:unnamed protein product, partial [marine sediment metagenome]